MDWSWVGVAVTGVCGAVTTYVAYRVNNKEIGELAKRMGRVEVSEEKCQERLRTVMIENQIMRDVVPKKLVDGIDVLVGETKKQTAHLEASDKHLESVARGMDKISSWDSDPAKRMGDKIDAMGNKIDAMRDMAVAQGHKIEDIDRVLDKMAQAPPTVSLEITKGPDSTLTVEERPHK